MPADQKAGQAVRHPALVRILSVADARDAGSVVVDGLAFDQFVVDNAFDDETAAAIASDLADHGFHLVGGGAAPLFRIEALGRIELADEGPDRSLVP